MDLASFCQRDFEAYYDMQQNGYPEDEKNLPRNIEIVQNGEIELIAHFPIDIFVVPHFNFVCNEPTIMHRHDFFEIIYVYQGACETIIDRKKIVQRTGDSCILNLQAAHTIRVLKPEESIVYNILIRQTAFDNAYLKLISHSSLVSDFFLESLKNKKQADNYLLFYENELDPFAKNLIQLIIYEHYEGKEFKEKMLEQLFSSLLIEFSRIYHSRLDLKTTKELDGCNISDIIQFIIDHSDDISLKDLAKHFHYTEVYLSKLIKKYAGANFSDILQNIRFKKAAALLRDTDMTISDIMVASGYANRSWFTKKFIELYKMSPAEYRRANSPLQKG